MRTINQMTERVHEIAKSKGWWEGGERSVSEIIALCHSELSEALEAAREGLPSVCLYDKETKTFVPEPEIVRIQQQGMTDQERARLKPEGIAVELADCVIRVMDYFGYMGWDLEAVIKLKVAYNETRPHKHGNKAF